MDTCTGKKKEWKKSRIFTRRLEVRLDEVLKFKKTKIIYNNTEDTIMFEYFILVYM